MALIGSQSPVFSSVPVGDATKGDLAVEFCRWARMTLFPWQEDLLRDSCLTVNVADEEDPSVLVEQWAAPEIVVVVSRQNGKGEYLIALELSAVYLFGEKEVLHTAHYTNTSLKALERTWEVIANSPDLMQWAPWVEEYGPGAASTPKKIVSNGKECIRFPNGAEIAFRTRSGTQGAGTSNGLLILDECFDLPAGTADALTYTTRARENPRTVYISSPVNRDNPKHLHGQKFSAMRWAGIDKTPGILFKEWSLEDGDDPLTEDAMVKTNPSLVTSGVGKQKRFVMNEARKARSSEMTLRSYKVEDLGTGNWFPREGTAGDFTPVIDLDDWAVKEVKNPVIRGESSLGMEVEKDGTQLGLVSAFRSQFGIHLCLAPLDTFTTDVVVKAILATAEHEDPVALCMGTRGQAAALEPDFKREGIAPEMLGTAKLARALELFFMLWREGQITHDGSERWLRALQVMELRPVADGNLIKHHPDAVVFIAAVMAIWGLVTNETPEDVDVEVKPSYGFVEGLILQADAPAFTF